MAWRLMQDLIFNSWLIVDYRGFLRIAGEPLTTPTITHLKKNDVKKANKNLNDLKKKFNKINW